MDQQTARGIPTQPQQWQDAQIDWDRSAVITAILAGFRAGSLAVPTPEGLSVAGQRGLAVAAVTIPALLSSGRRAIGHKAWRARRHRARGWPG